MLIRLFVLCIRFFTLYFVVLFTSRVIGWENCVFAQDKLLAGMIVCEVNYTVFRKNTHIYFAAY